MQVEIQHTTASATPPTFAQDIAPGTAQITAQDSVSVSGFTNLSIVRNLKIGTFHIGSSMADILGNGVWNRIMISELGFAATPVALLLALRYFLAPLSLWFGYLSDSRPLRGFHRLPYIWGGRLIMVLSYFLLGISTLELAGSYDPMLRELTFGYASGTAAVNSNSALGWLGVVAALVLFSVGSAASGTVFLSLIHDRAPRPQRGRAVSVVWFFLIAGFAVSGIFFSRLLPAYTRDGFLALFLFAPAVMGALWLFSVWGEEHPSRPGTVRQGAESGTELLRPGQFWMHLKAIWASRQARLFFVFLSLTTVFFYLQDIILEPFGAEVFGMTVEQTSRFASYWGSVALVAILGAVALSRRMPKRFNNISMSRWSVILLTGGFVLWAVCAFAQIRPLLTPSLLLMGLGLGIWTVGTLGLMMNMTRVWGAGLYLALWTVASTLARGAGVAIGGVLLDVALALTGGQQAAAYGLVFSVQVVGFAYTLRVLSQINLATFEQEAPRMETVAANAMD